ncbi:MAG TPA: nitrite reductase (NAD(P)H) small subunit [Gemmatimonadaceae bacterium]|jgi:nitrite reductase/ring-hydroxylating ferredoxin subunit
MEPFLHVASLSDFPPAAGLAVRLGGQPIALFHVDGQVFALDDVCARCGQSLAAGTLAGHDVECTGCGWRYDVVTGRLYDVASLRLDTFAVQTRGATVSVANSFVRHTFR